MIVFLAASIALASAPVAFHEPVDGQLPYFLKEDLAPVWKVVPGRELSSLVRIPDFELSSQQVARFRASEQLRGKVAIANFFFASCPGYCPRMTRNVKKAFDRLRGRKDVVFISYSVTPTIDTRDALKAFARKHGVDGANWHFLTGSRDTIYDLARNHFQSDLAVDLNQGKDQFVHSENIYLLDPSRLLRGVYNSSDPLEVSQLVEDVATLLSRRKQ